MDGHAPKDLARSSWRPQTRLVRGGLKRSAFAETSEAIYLTSGFVYDSAEWLGRLLKPDRSSGTWTGHIPCYRHRYFICLTGILRSITWASVAIWPDRLAAT